MNNILCTQITSVFQISSRSSVSILALTLTLPVQAAIYEARSQDTLKQAIVAANQSPGQDVIDIQNDIILNQPLPLPFLKSDLIIKGNGHSIDGMTSIEFSLLKKVQCISLM